MLSIGADAHRADAHTGVHQGPISFVSSGELRVQQGLRVPIHIDDLNEVLGKEEWIKQARPGTTVRGEE